MNNDLSKQGKYWDGAIEDFDAIYSHKKGFAGNLMDRLFRWDMYKRFEYTMEHSEPVEGRTILDVGCGTGRYSLEYARRGAALVVGIDVSENMVRTCTERSEKLGVSQKTRFIHSDLLGYTPDVVFDVVIGIGLFDYIRDPAPVLKKMFHCTRDRAILSFPTVWTWKAPVRKINLARGNCDVYFYTRQHVRDLIAGAGFPGMSMVKIGQLYCVTAKKH